MKKYYVDNSEVSEKIFYMVLQLEGALFEEEDTTKYARDTIEQIKKYGSIYNGLTNLTFSIKESEMLESEKKI